MSGKSMRLSFKGDPKLKKKKKKSSASSSTATDGIDTKGKRRARDGAAAAESDVEDVGGDEQAWVYAESALDVNGPCFLYQELPDASGKRVPYALQFNTTTQQLQPVSVLPPDLSDQLHSGAGAALALAGVAGSEAEGAAIAGIETTPTSVHQVFVASRVAGTDAWNLKSAEGRYLGLVSSPSSAKSEEGAPPALTAVNAQAEARGPNEAWFLERVAGLGGSCAGIALRSAAGGYLQLDEVAGGKVVVRADGTGPSAGEGAWQVKVQWKHRHAARREHLHAGPTLSGSGLKQAYDPAADLGSGAEALGKLNRSRLGLIGGKQVDISNRGLAKAAKEGRLAEEMLERRIKAKSDRYAKCKSRSSTA